MKTVQLQGVGRVPAVTVAELRPYGGDVVLWNYGYKSLVLRVIASDTGETCAVTMRSMETGKVSIRRMNSATLVAVEGVTV